MRKRRPEAGRIWTQDLEVGMPSLKLQCHYWFSYEPYVRVQHLPRTYVWYISCIVCCTQLAISRLSRVSLLESLVHRIQTLGPPRCSFARFSSLIDSTLMKLNLSRRENSFPMIYSRKACNGWKDLNYNYWTTPTRLKLLDFTYWTTNIWLQLDFALRGRGLDFCFYFWPFWTFQACFAPSCPTKHPFFKVCSVVSLPKTRWSTHYS